MPRAAVLFLLLAPLAAWAGDAGYATREIALRAEPAATAKTVGTLAKGAKVEIVAEQKAWSQVKAEGLSGWTLSFYVMKGEPAQVGMGERLSGLWTLGTNRRPQTTATLGVRGLDEEDLKGAQFNADELKSLESLAVSKPDGEAFARQRRLQAQKVDYLQAPQAAASEAKASRSKDSE